MGLCSSSTKYVVDPVTGQETKKTHLGGAPPGLRRPQQQPYTPPASDFKDGKATAHFVAYGGGNALTLVQKDGTTKPQMGPKPPEYIEVTIPEGIAGGQKIHVQAPDGRLNEVIVPAGFGPGDTFTVEFADVMDHVSSPTSNYDSKQSYNEPPSASAPSEQEVPEVQVYLPYGSVANQNALEGGSSNSNYPSAVAKPVY